MPKYKKIRLPLPHGGKTSRSTGSDALGGKAALHRGDNRAHGRRLAQKASEHASSPLSRYIYNYIIGRAHGLVNAPKYTNFFPKTT